MKKMENWMKTRDTIDLKKIIIQKARENKNR